MIALIIHGGCHDLPPGEEEKKAIINSLNEYGNRGYEMLMKGSSALDAVEAIISNLEDDPLFDAGTGSFKNLKGEIEMDALLMTSANKCGGVICIQNVQHPIQVARKVMEKTPHNLLTGKGAEEFARAQGFPYFDPDRHTTRPYNERDKEKGSRALNDIQYYRDTIRQNDHQFSTVGMVALDASGNLASGTSTGGIRLKLPGRVGDSAIPGAGTYCNKEVGLSATGEGEGIMKLCLTYSIASDYLKGRDISQSCYLAIQAASSVDCVCGVVALTASGEFSYAHNGYFMPVYMNRY